jgi:hypothetical protein
MIAAAITSGFERMEQKFQALGLEFRSGLPQVLHERITPSQASGKTVAEFCAWLSQLGLPTEVDDAKSIFTKRQDDDRQDFSFVWEQYFSSLVSIPEAQTTTQDLDEEQSTAAGVNKNQLEPKSYEPLCAYLCNLGFDAVVVGHGQGLPNKLLYSVQAFSMRKQKSSGQKVFFVKTIEGLTDLVVLDTLGIPSQVTRERVKFAIEVKIPTELKDRDVNAGGSESAGTKERISQSVITQLLGLNIRNPYNAPPVLLTNLCRSNFVYYITEHDVYPWFRIARQRCSTFLAGLQFVEDILKSDRCTGEFGRPCSPDLQT